MVRYPLAGGFWPGLCVSLKHNSKFASFIILAKGDYPAELDIPIPFSLVSNEVSSNELLVMPAYWFLYNMYALARNSRKYVDRDGRTDKTQLIEYDFLAPDSINEMITALALIERYTGKAYVKQYENNKSYTAEELQAIGKRLLMDKTGSGASLEIIGEGFEHSDRKVKLIKSSQAYHLFREMISYYAATQVLQCILSHNFKTLTEIQAALPGGVQSAQHG